MAWYEDVFKANSAGGIAAGAAAFLVAPVVLPAVAGAVRPLAKAVVKSGVILYDRGREAVTGVWEMGEDLVAEARAELDRGEEATLAGALGAGVTGAAANVREAVAGDRGGRGVESASGSEHTTRQSKKEEAGKA